MTPVDVDVRIDSDGMRVAVGNGLRERTLTYRVSAMLPLTSKSANAPHHREFFEFFLALYTADRLTKRSPSCWKRNFRLRIPVTYPESWKVIHSEITRLIKQSTGDDVEINFIQRPLEQRHADSHATHFCFEEPRPTSVVLLSDGLDSLCGAFQQVARNPEERVAFVSIVTNARKGARLQNVRAELEMLYPDRVTFLEARLHMQHAPRDQEQSQRSRTMLAIAAGLTVAAGYGSPTVAVSENGMGILNLPVPGLQMIHHSSQVLHPGNRALWKRIANQLVGGGEVVYPNRFRTKAEMCLALPPKALALVKHTSSCDRPDRYDASDNCGRCGSCVFRMMALEVSGLTDYDITYSTRPTPTSPPPFDASVVQRHHAKVLKEHLSMSDPWPTLVRSHPSLRTVLADEEVGETLHLRAETLGLLARHVGEVLSPSRLRLAS